MHPSFTVTALGSRVRVEIEEGAVDATQFDELLDLWERCGAREPAGEPSVDATVRRTVRRVDDDAPATPAGGSWPASASFRGLADRLSADVTGSAIENARGRLLMLHAAALADPATGRVLAFVGPSGKGKTTVSRHLGRRLHYLSDETTGLTPDLLVEPYPKPLSLRLAADGRPKRQVAPASLGLLAAGPRPYRLHRVVVLDRREDAPRHPLVRPLRITAALAAVTSEISHLRSLDMPLQRLAAACSAGGGAVRVTYRDADDIVGVLDELFDDDGTPPTWEVVDVELAPDASASAEPSVRRLPVDDAVADEAGLAVFRDGVVHVLAGIGPAVWSATGRARTVDDLTATVVAEFGAPDGVDAEQIVGAAVDELVAARLLEWVTR